MLKGKVVIVTGGTKGIGKGIADTFHKYGAKVVICARKKIKSKYLCIECDVSDPNAVNNLIAETIKKYKRVDILINNAGIYPFVHLKDMKEEEWDQMINTDLKGVYLCTKAVLPYMIKQKYGKIVNISSIAGGCIGFNNLVHYSSAKAGIVGFTKSAALDLARYNINVNAIAPGAIDTPGTKPVMISKTKKTILQHIPKGRMGKPEDIAEAAAFLASDKSDYITGQLIVVDGGYTIT
ncbi:MAG: SDR family NAD(P)-dependent oxidoreductase [Nanoarchaeota archaeon]|nr:SDR family NAD(P)-dependent oxidoreductase [Nanoarchaeota archaeon]